MRQQIRAIRQHIDYELRVADFHHVEKTRARRCIDIERQNSLVIRAKAKLARRAQHSLGDFASDLPLLDLEAAGQHSAHAGERIKRSFHDVRGAAHNVVNHAGTGVDLRHPQMVRVRMRRSLDNAAYYNACEILAELHDVVDCRAAHRKHLAQLRGRHVDIDEVPEPSI